MARKEINQTIINELFPRELSKADKRRLDILEAAIRTYANLGIEYVSYEDIAREAKTSRPLVQHYFPDKNELFALAMKSVRAQFQDLAVRAMSNVQDPVLLLSEYVRSTFRWVEKSPAHGKAWLFFFYLCPSNKNLRKMHWELTKMGQQRIVAILESGVKTKDFSPAQLPDRAKLIQQIITGALIELVTENDMPMVDKLMESAVKSCLMIAQLDKDAVTNF